ncbi:MAG: hypothetical protein A2249_03070 [Candidatus Jacksonbacteria bacterium RIFOXYA2_FULL_44_7]|uniref:Uncharacterized protein n=1 Tax=Candidatus Jacksonbacteria bacterium RIFCSPLOWO2_02_FULL_44_20 TaxID=1798460 RepID=A0A1G2A9X6_9BACT|nr:MAG: hypothetical protein UW39_C0016G0023 [Parcubacteria group bacterium GW2011_GWC2_44_17]KKT48776.1 MAG: hypothetical protein UW40_C0033G0005 [Parcubacteria group bacterium GW2011_GWF2_44_17]OGY71096.1 MAG: hypothetical protein A3E05_00315 [Candidatus Jacksonbacteria bacterium RIFCSPHIGHO2_12_FULL_44_12]OGY71492.1 MAG: hypothetical protein A3C00_00735 [Candidatus Jacksonbacteria bacterium RIFCSPHIGHO2_02_FULL_44_25]OGY73286.1 MAG: hypothetical protein A3H61_00945 [Candidatus Jacksonbacteri
MGEKIQSDQSAVDKASNQDSDVKRQQYAERLQKSGALIDKEKRDAIERVRSAEEKQVKKEWEQEGAVEQRKIYPERVLELIQQLRNHTAEINSARLLMEELFGDKVLKLDWLSESRFLSGVELKQIVKDVISQTGFTKEEAEPLCQEAEKRGMKRKV